ncbi:CaiB/BaiF CoA-transferase family protein [Conexibacter stalactiti]|uniref:CaiB/BaiF CoA-transferase family protein n=1 Tax=Conexibacter stalactiti TaxID=1940611 RepID=A0ABU4HIM1_9ACTN|nr:CaiB/BaiF CoA-transferase family protein [Conexibacter stalactiti]MDW5593161.1 CaiB/BaiF CoA-transferase family protein [Conexibacter stalactiti]MEC5033802.1 CaiB/BaiF CoA-transferase family protein [Conexibacter stalactiti]
MTQAGPLTGVRVVEIGAIGPGPFAAMLLADMGADVVRLERPGSAGLGSGAWNLTNRNRRSVGIDLKADGAAELVLRLCAGADALIEGFRPGVMERLGLGPDVVLARSPKLVYGRMTGYGQDGPLSQVAGHDVNYIAIAGALGAMRRGGERPLPPLNLVGDYGGGAMFLAFGLLCGIVEARGSGRGQVVDAAMVDGTAVLTTIVHALRAGGQWPGPPGTNLLDSGAHFYEVYATADGEHVAVGAIEPQFYARLLELLDLPADELPQFDRARWPLFKQRIAAAIATRTRAEWAELLEGEEACATAVYRPEEAPAHPHNVARGTFTEFEGVLQPAPAPRFSRTPGTLRTPPRDPGADTDDALTDWGVDRDEIERLRDAGVVS